MSDLTELGLKYGTDKSENGYTRIYEEFLSDKRNEKNNILEIGVGRGASLRMWAEYFPESFILGMDREDIAQELRIAIVKAARHFDGSK